MGLSHGKESRELRRLLRKVAGGIRKWKTPCLPCSIVEKSQDQDSRESPEGDTVCRQGLRSGFEGIIL